MCKNRLSQSGQLRTVAYPCTQSSERLLHFGSCRKANSLYSATAAVQPCIRVGQQWPGSYLKGRAAGIPPAELERTVRRWFVMSVLTGRYSASPETKFDEDVRSMESQGVTAFADAVIASQLSESYWTGLLPRNLETSSASSPFFLAYQAAQVKLGDKGFLSRDITALDLILNRCDVHHLYPRNHLKGQGLSKGKYNQIANFVLTQTEINISIGDKAPETYFAELAAQCEGGAKKYGGIDNVEEMRANLRANCVPERLLDGDVPAFDDYLEERRTLMAAKIREYFGKL